MTRKDFAMALLFLLLCWHDLAIASHFKFATCIYPPYEYQENGIDKGLDVEILQTIAKRRHIDIQIEFIPWNRAVLEAERGSVDAVFSLVKNEEREKYLLYPSVPLYINDAKLFSLPAFPVTINRLDDLKGLRVGLEAGNTYGQQFDEATFFIKDEAADQKVLIQKFLAGRTPLIITAEAVGNYILKENKINEYRIHPFIVTKEVCYVGISKKSPRAQELFKILETELKIMQRSGELDKIRQKHMKKAP